MMEMLTTEMELGLEMEATMKMKTTIIVTDYNGSCNDVEPRNGIKPSEVK